RTRSSALPGVSGRGSQPRRGVLHDHGTSRGTRGDAFMTAPWWTDVLEGWRLAHAERRIAQEDEVQKYLDARSKQLPELVRSILHLHVLAIAFLGVYPAIIEVGAAALLATLAVWWERPLGILSLLALLAGFASLPWLRLAGVARINQFLALHAGSR